MRQNGAQRRVDLGREEPVSFARRITEHAVHDVRRRFESQRAFDFLASTPEAVCVIDDRQRLVLWNAGARELLGFEASDVVGRCCFEVLQAQDPTGAAVCRRCCEAQRAAAAGDLVPSCDLQVMTKNNGRMKVTAATIVFPSRWVAHLLHPENGNAAKRSENVLRRLDPSVTLDGCEP